MRPGYYVLEGERGFHDNHDRIRLGHLAGELGPAAGVVPPRPRGALPGHARHGRGAGRPGAACPGPRVRYGKYHGPALRKVPEGGQHRRRPRPRAARPSPRAPSRATTGSRSSRRTSRSPTGLPGCRTTRYDAVLTATALHWLHSEPLAVLYGQIAELVRDGGVFMNADHMIDETTPRINAADRAQRHARMDEAKASRRPRLVRVVATRGPGPGPRRTDGPPLRDLRRPRRRRHPVRRMARPHPAGEGLRGVPHRSGAPRRTPWFSRSSNQAPRRGRGELRAQPHDPRASNRPSPARNTKGAVRNPVPPRRTPAQPPEAGSIGQERLRTLILRIRQHSRG